MNNNKIEMKKTVVTLSIYIIASMTGFGQEKTPQTYDDGVVINGVKWATCNVDEAGAFAPTPEGTEWEKANDPSPAGKVLAFVAWQITKKSEESFEEVVRKCSIALPQ